MKWKLVFMLCMAIGLVTAQQAKEKSCGGGCCGGEKMAMADMQDHHQHKHVNEKDSTTRIEKKRSSVEYTCSMHPEVKSDKPGECPKCGMALVEMKPEKKSDMKSPMKNKQH